MVLKQISENVPTCYSFAKIFFKVVSDAAFFSASSGKSPPHVNTKELHLAWENSRDYVTPAFPAKPNVWETSAEIPYWWRVATRHVWEVLLIGRAVREIKFAKTNQKHYPVGWVVTRYQYGFPRSFILSDVILRGKYWWCCEMSAVFLDCVALRDTAQLTVHLSCVASLTNGQQFSLVYILIDRSSRSLIERELIQLL